MEDGIFPHLRALTDPDELEEERRLCYVGITRAEERLYMTHAWSRMLFGQSQYNPPSRFLDEIPENLIVEAEGSRGRRKSSGSGGVFGGSGTSSRAGRQGSMFGGRDEIVDTALKPRGNSLTGPSVFGGSGGASSSGAGTLDLRTGDDVMHKKWGEGVILSIRGGGDKAEAVVRFPSVGEKTLLLAWAPLQKV